MSANVDSMIKEAIKAYRAGDKASARAMLEKATELDQHSEKAWMWLSAVVDSVEDQRVCLENVLFLNPDNENAKRGLSILDSQTPGSSAVGSESPAAPPAPTAPAGQDDYVPIASSSASATFDASNAPSADEYDDWISNMGIGADSSADSSEDMTSGPFTMESGGFEDVFAGAFDDDPYGDYDEYDSSSPASTTADDLFATDDDLFAQDTFDTDDVMAGNIDSDALFAGQDDLFATDDDLFGSGGDDSFADPFATAATPVDKVAPPVKASRNKRSKSSKRKKRSSQSAFVDSGTGEEPDPSYYFNAIPKQIKKTRMPGKGSRRSPVTLLLFLVLIAGNIGAAAMLAMA